jgi:hypothetical protein
MHEVETKMEVVALPMLSPLSTFGHVLNPDGKGFLVNPQTLKVCVYLRWNVLGDTSSHHIESIHRA